MLIAVAAIVGALPAPEASEGNEPEAISGPFPVWNDMQGLNCQPGVDYCFEDIVKELRKSFQLPLVQLYYIVLITARRRPAVSPLSILLRPLNS